MSTSQLVNNHLIGVTSHVGFPWYTKGEGGRTAARYSYLTGSEGDPVVVLHSFFLLPFIQLLPADADCHRSQMVIYPKIVLMLWKQRQKKKIRITHTLQLTQENLCYRSFSYRCFFWSKVPLFIKRTRTRTHTHAHARTFFWGGLLQIEIGSLWIKTWEFRLVLAAFGFKK